VDAGEHSAFQIPAKPLQIATNYYQQSIENQ